MLKMQWTGIDTVIRNLVQYEVDQRARLRLACEEVAQMLERYAIMNHPWEVRTQGTNVSTKGTWDELPGDLYEVVLSAGMSYNPYLELAGPNRGDFAQHEAALPHMALNNFGGGRWSWLWPAVVANHQAIIDTFVRHLRH